MMIIHMDSTSKIDAFNLHFFFGMAIVEKIQAFTHGGFCGCVASVVICGTCLFGVIVFCYQYHYILSIFTNRQDHL